MFGLVYDHVLKFYHIICRTILVLYIHFNYIVASTGFLLFKRTMSEHLPTPQQLRVEAENLNRRGEEAQRREGELEEQADRVHMAADTLEQYTIPNLQQEFYNARENMSNLEEEERESLIKQETCRFRARDLRAIELRLRAEADEKRAMAEEMRQESGAQGMFGLQKDQMGFHRQAAPFNERAAALGQKAQVLEREAEAAQTEANQNECEIERLLNHAMARAVYRRELEEQRGNFEQRIDNARRQVENKRRERDDLKVQETRLREEEGVFCNKALDLFDEAKKAEAKAEEIEREAARPAWPL